MPIEGLTKSRRLHRVGKVRIGGQRSDHAPGRPLDHFEVRADETTSQQAADAFRERYGEQPRELDIIFPTDDETLFADPNMKLYGSTWGLVCCGTGLDRDHPGVAVAKWDLEQDGPRPEGVPSGTWARVGTKSWVSREIVCLGDDCPKQQSRECRMAMSLQFVLPDVRGIGVWQLDTGSWNSVRNVLDGIDTVKTVSGGRIRSIPLKLRLLAKQVTPRDGSVSRKTVYVLDLSLPDVSLDELVRSAARLPAVGLLPPPPREEDEPPDDEPPDDQEAAVDPETGEAGEVDPHLKGVGELLIWAEETFGWDADHVCRVLFVKEPAAIDDLEEARDRLRVVAREEQPGLIG